MKFNYKELLESMKRELSVEEIIQIKMAIMAYDLDLKSNEIIEELFYKVYNQKDTSYFISDEFVNEYYLTYNNEEND